MTTETVDVVLPCRNEAAALPLVLSGFPLGFRAIVVDNGSTDGSAAIAAEHGAIAVSEPEPGYGAAIHCGLARATSELVGFLDADASLDPGELPRLVEPVRAGIADLAVGRRVPVTAAAWPWHARAGNWLLAALIRSIGRRNGFVVRDIAPIRVVRRTALLDLEVWDRRFGYPLELLLKAARAGWRVREFDVAYRARAHGTVSKVSGSALGTARAVHDMGKVLLR